MLVTKMLRIITNVLVESKVRGLGIIMVLERMGSDQVFYLYFKFSMFEMEVILVFLDLYIHGNFGFIDLY